MYQSFLKALVFVRNVCQEQSNFERITKRSSYFFLGRLSNCRNILGPSVSGIPSCDKRLFQSASGTSDYIRPIKVCLLFQDAMNTFTEAEEVMLKKVKAVVVFLKSR